MGVYFMLKYKCDPYLCEPFFFHQSSQQRLKKKQCFFLILVFSTLFDEIKQESGCKDSSVFRVVDNRFVTYKRLGSGNLKIGILRWGHMQRKASWCP